MSLPSILDFKSHSAFSNALIALNIIPGRAWRYLYLKFKTISSIELNFLFFNKFPISFIAVIKVASELLLSVNSENPITPSCDSTQRISQFRQPAGIW
jgi:hypothetical protein